MKALSVLLVLVLSTPSNECLDTQTLASILKDKHYVFSRLTPPNTLELIDWQHGRYVDIWVNGNVSCVVGEGSLS